MLYNSYPALAFDGSNLRALRARRVPTQTFFDTCNDDIFQVVVKFLSIGNLRKFALLCCQSRYMVWEILRSETIVANESHISDDDLKFLCRLPLEIRNLCHNGVTYRFRRDLLSLKIQLGYLYLPPCWDRFSFLNDAKGSMTRRLCIIPSSHFFCNTTIKANCTILDGRVCLTMRVIDTSNVNNILSSSCEEKFGLSSFYKERIGSSCVIFKLLQTEAKLRQYLKMHKKYVIRESDYLKKRKQFCEPNVKTHITQRLEYLVSRPHKKSHH